MEKQGEIILYHPDESITLDVVLENETVWLTQQQMTELFKSTKQNVSLHIHNIFKEKELSEPSTVKFSLTVQKEGMRTVKRKIAYYNLDVIISVGYRIKSQRGTDFRIWATQVLKEYLLKGYSINYRIEKLEQRVTNTENKIDFFVRTSLPPVEGVFFDGQIFDAYEFVAKLIKSASKSLVLIDNYVDESVLTMLAKRSPGVSAKIITLQISKQLQLDIDKFNSQYAPVDVMSRPRIHDRFLIVDGKDVYHIGASMKDLGKKMFAFSKMEINADVIMRYLDK